MESIDRTGCPQHSSEDILKRHFTRLNVFPTCMYVHHVGTQCLKRPELGVGASGSVITNDHELSFCGVYLVFSAELLKGWL